MDAQQMWKLYTNSEKISGNYEAWAFGDAPDELAQLVLKGEKTGTSSAYIWYDIENEPLPKVGEYSVILDSNDDAVCIIRNIRVYVTSFEQVTEEHARKEGEGDRSLAYWRKVHENFFTKELSEAGYAFDEKMGIVCEEFVRVFP